METMILYHGTTSDRASSIVAAGTYLPGYTNPWSGTPFDGLMCSNVREYAEQYGDAVVEIVVDEAAILVFQDCPIGPGDYGWIPEFGDALEYLIPEGVSFTARIA